MTEQTTERTWGGLRRTSSAELLEWHRAEHELPDADITVLLWIGTGTEADWAAGWWDGEAWRLAESGGVCAGVVYAWAEPEGPAS
jgi:hypothetical protein